MTVNAMIADLESEQDSLDQIVADLESSRWLLATESPTWTIADQISHLQFFDERAALALSDPEAFVLDRKRIIAAAPHDCPLIWVDRSRLLSYCRRGGTRGAHSFMRRQLLIQRSECRGTDPQWR